VPSGQCHGSFNGLLTVAPEKSSCSKCAATMDRVAPVTPSVTIVVRLFKLTPEGRIARTHVNLQLVVQGADGAQTDAAWRSESGEHQS
jgi:hypothetical protein